MRTLSVFIFLTCIACTKPSEPSEDQVSKPITSDTIYVALYKSKFEPLKYPVKTIGKVRSTLSSKLIFERSGILEEIKITNGSWAKKGSIIASLRNRAEWLKKEQAEIELKQALSLFENELLKIADSSYYGDGWGRVKEKLLLNSGVTQAKARLNQTSYEYALSFIRAAHTGVVEGIKIRPGDFINTGTELGSIYDPTQYEVECLVLEYDLLKIRKGEEVKIFPLADNTNPMKGVIREVNPAVDSRGQSLVKINLLNTKNIVPGLSVRVEINVTDQPSIVIPMEAVVNRSDRQVVFNVENGLAKWNYVTLGKNNGVEVQVLEGLTEGMEVIITNNLQLAHDSPVRLE